MMLIGKLNIYVKFIDYSTSFVPNCERDESITKKSLRLGSVSAIKFREIDFKVITRSLINTIIRIDKIEIKKKIMAIKRKYKGTQYLYAYFKTEEDLGWAVTKGWKDPIYIEQRFYKKNGSTTIDNAKEKEVIQIQENEVTELMNEYRSDRTKI
ncbi:13759_t:CDS:2 [Rhizophagus irregularis]|nr:13759_t:CDS:2 [Rhizophagus irregularis]